MQDFFNTKVGAIGALIVSGLFLPELGAVGLFLLLLHASWRGLSLVPVFLRSAPKVHHPRPVRTRTERERRSPKPSPVKQETIDDLYGEVVKAFEENCALIEKSPMDEKVKGDAIKEEKRKLDKKIKNLLR